MSRFKNFFRRLWKDEAAQGMAEYALLLVVIVAIAFLFKDKIKGAVSGKLEQLGNDIKSFD